MVFLPPFSKNQISEYIYYNKQSQIAVFDLTVKDIIALESDGVLDFDNSKRFVPDHKIITPKDGKWILEPGGYLTRYNEIIEVPLSAIGIVLPRSSLMRIGGTICSALWDPGYKGRGIGLLIVYTRITIHQNARIAQIIFLKTLEESKNGYSGEYQNENISTEED